MTPYVTLELFKDQAAEDRIAVEGFETTEQLADFVLFAADQLHPDWTTVRADNHDDVRKVLSMLETIEATARFLVNLDYDEAEVRRTLTMQFPGGDVDAAMEDARAHKARLDAEIAAVTARDDQAARAAEHDLGRSMHDGS